jgi:hypothetical protein
LRLLAYVTGLINQERLLQNEYLAEGKSNPETQLRLSDAERSRAR